MDTFICGSCRASFAGLQEFLSHKSSPCSGVVEEPPASSPARPVKDDSISGVVTHAHLPLNSRQGIEDLAVAQSLTKSKDLVASQPGDGTIYLCKDCNSYAIDLTDLQKHCSLVHNTPLDALETAIVPLRPLNPARTLTVSLAGPAVKRKRGRPRKHPRVEGAVLAPKTSVPTVEVADAVGKKDHEDGEEKKPRRKPGRPRKTEEDRALEKKQRLERIEMVEEDMKQEGSICKVCGKAFSRTRQLMSHRCQPDNPDLNFKGEEDDQARASLDDPVSSDEDVDELEAIHFDQDSIPDKLNLPTHEIPQILNGNAIPDLRINKSGTLKMYICPICRKFFKTRSLLVTHLAVHSNTSKGNKRMLSTYKKKLPSKQQPVECDLCRTKHLGLTKLLRHLEVEHSLETDPQARSYYQQQKLQRQLSRQNLIFQCRICNRIFKDRENHKKHLMLHQSCKPLQCSMCPYTAFRFVYIETHAKRHWFIYICHVCNTKVLSLELLRMHLTTHELPDNMSAADFLTQSINTSIYQSGSIDTEIADEIKRKTEMRSQENDSQNLAMAANFLESEGNDVNNQPEKRYGAEYLDILYTPIIEESELQSIGKEFTQLSFKRLSCEILREIQALFGDKECPVCGKLFNVRTQLESHKKTHQKEKDFKCESCSYSSHTKQGLKRHVDTVHIGTNLKCPSCNFETTSSTYLQEHLKKHQGLQVYRCTRCDLSTEQEDEMKQHIAEKHPELTRSELVQIMGKHFHVRNKMGKLGSHRCQHCGLVFRRLCDLRRHVWLHSGINPFKCNVCKFECRTQSNLKSHMMKHSETKNHLCDTCGKAFKMMGALKAHRMAQHPDIKQHRCKLCDFQTDMESQMKAHAVIHNQSTAHTFRCFQCTQFSSDKDSLREHYRVEHPDIVFDETLPYEIPEDRITTLNICINNKDGVVHYKCSQCNVNLANNGELGLHLREAHGLAITTTTEADGEMNQEQVDVGSLTDQMDLSNLPQGLEVHMIDAMAEDQNSAMQLLQQIIDLQASAAENDGSMTEPSQQQYALQDNTQQLQDHSGADISETVAAVNYLTSTATLNALPGQDLPGPHTGQNIQPAQSYQMEHPSLSQPNLHNGSSEVIPDAVFVQGDGTQTCQDGSHVSETVQSASSLPMNL